MLNLVISFLMFYILVFSTFLVVKLPFITFNLSNFPLGTAIEYSNNYIAYGLFSSSLQIPAIIFASLLLKPRLFTTFIIIYLTIGIYQFPIFYTGGGVEYLKQPTLGYLISTILVSLLISNLSWRYDNLEKYLYNAKFTFFISSLGLLITHIIGGVSLYILSKYTIGLFNIFSAYFLIPFPSQILLIAVVCIFAGNINRFRFYLISQYNKFMKFAVQSTKRRKLARKNIV